MSIMFCVFSNLLVELFAPHLVNDFVDENEKVCNVVNRGTNDCVVRFEQQPHKEFVIIYLLHLFIICKESYFSRCDVAKNLV